MLLRISTLATGRTGIREETLGCCRHAQRRLTPVVYEYGSLGCSGTWPRLLTVPSR